MSKKGIVIVISLVLCFISLSAVAAADSDALNLSTSNVHSPLENSNEDNVTDDLSTNLSSINNDESTLNSAVINQNLEKSSKNNTLILLDNVSSFDKLGNYINLTLINEKGDILIGQNVSFSLNGVNYNRVTDDNGMAFLKINLADGAYDITANYKGSEIYNYSSKTAVIYVVSHSVLIDKNLSNVEIQNIIDNADEGKDILFLGDYYVDLSLVINKPVNIISKMNTTISSSNVIFTIKDLKNGQVNISGFKLNGQKDLIYILNSENVNVWGNVLSSSHGNAININGGDNVSIMYNIITNGYNGIRLQNSQNIDILNNNMSGAWISGIGTGTGIYLGDNTNNINIINNEIFGFRVGIYSSKGSGESIFINSNYIHDTDDGISLDGSSENLIVSQNVVTNNTGVGLWFGENYQYSETADISYNVLVGNFLEIQNKFETSGEIGYQWVGSNTRTNSICGCAKFKYIQFKLFQNPDGSFLAGFYDDKGIATKLPSVAVQFVLNNGNSLSVFSKDGVATLNQLSPYDLKGSSVLDAIAHYQKETTSLTQAMIDLYNNYYNENHKSDNSGNGTGTGSGNGGSGSGTSGSGSGTGSGSTSTNIGLSSAVDSVITSSSSTTDSYSSSAALSTGQSQTTEDSAKNSVTKFLESQEELVRLAGIGGLVILMILTVLIYYRKDIEYLIRQNH